MHNSDVFYVVSKMEPREDLRVGDRVGVQLDPARVHVFDPQTGENWVRKPAGQ